MYIQGTKDFGLLYIKNDDFTLVGYPYEDFAGDIDDTISTSSYLTNMGLVVVYWSCKKHVIVENSST